MTVYVEYVLIDNLVIDWLVLKICSKILKTRTSKKRLFLGALCGTAIALVTPFLPSWITLPTKLLTAVLMVILSFRPAKFKLLALQVLMLFFCTFLFGGAVVGVMEMLCIPYNLQNGINYQNQFPVGLAVLVCYIVYIVAKNLLTFCTKKHQNLQFCYKLTICDQQKITIDAFLDSGNCLSLNGKPITIINFKVFNLLYPNISVTDLLLKKPLPLKQQKYVDVKGVSSKSEKILTFQVDSLNVNNNQMQNAVLGLSLRDFSGDTNSDAIISKGVFEKDVFEKGVLKNEN